MQRKEFTPEQIRLMVAWSGKTALVAVNCMAIAYSVWVFATVKPLPVPGMASALAGAVTIYFTVLCVRTWMRPPFFRDYVAMIREVKAANSNPDAPSKSN